MNTLAADATGSRLYGCECCGLVSRAPAGANDGAIVLRCARCGHPLYERKPHSLQRTWAYLAASVLLYVPANALPIMTAGKLFHSESHTIAGGIAELWGDRAWGLAAIVFIASIAVPILKIGALALLAWSVQRAPAWRRLERAKLYRVVEAVGHWSMLDVYVVVLLAGMVRFGQIASAQPGPGLVAFTAVVILTMLAARSFDPRLIWQEPHEHD
jgi:paraquat-inducible protein A